MTASTLADCALGTRVRVDSVVTEHVTRRRLAELGIRPGARLLVLSRTAGGGRVVAVSEARIALDRRTAASVSATPELELVDGDAPAGDAGRTHRLAGAVA